MENFKNIFLRQIKNIPFIECVDKNKFYDEFLNSPKESLDIVLILSEININQTVDEFDIFKSLDEFNTEDKIKFKAKVLEIIKPKNEKYFIPNIQKTKTFKYLNEVWEVYYNFLKTITGNHNHNILGGKPLDAADFVTELKDIDFDRYKEVEITVNRILQLLEYFDNNTQNQIFEKLFDESIVKTILLGENKIYKSVEPIINHFKEDLKTKFSRLQLEKSNPKATQKQTIQEEIDNYIPNIPQKENLTQNKLDSYTDEEIDLINDYLEQYKDEGKIDDKNYDILVNALLSFINIKIFPEEKIKFKGKVGQKKLGTSIRHLLKEKGLDVDDRVLRFAKNYISIYENTPYYEGSKGRDNKLYQYFRENRY